ncbi:MAG: hypothetical protein OT477_17245 [Chloroflexi bacterium]|nr:hypothetical protein [Chloroflexota bacterium]
MRLEFKHYIWGMFLLPSDKQYIGGDEKIIAATDDIDTTLLQKVRQHVRTGLSSLHLKDQQAYGFFPFGDSEYIFCHYQSSKFTERPPSRGEHHFVHYIFVNEMQLDKLHWNLVPIFNLFTEIEPRIEKERLTPLELDTFVSLEDGRIWLDSVRSNIELTQATIIKLLSGLTRIEITSGPYQALERLNWLCGLIQCLPSEYRRTISFCTLADPIKEISAQIVFPTRSTLSSSPIDWKKPQPFRGDGSIYVTWISEIVQSESPDRFQNDISTLRLPQEKGESKTLASQFDLAVEFSKWAKNANQLDITNKDDLIRLTNDILKYRPIFSESEAVEWLGLIITHVIYLTEYDWGGDVLEAYPQLLMNRETKRGLIQRIVNETLQPNHIIHIAQFFIRLDAFAKKKRFHLLNEFLEDTFLECLKHDVKQGVILWKKLIAVGFMKGELWATKSLANIEAISKNQVATVIEIVLAYDNIIILPELEKLLNRSNLVSDYPETSTFLECFQPHAVAGSETILRALVNSYKELKNPHWLLFSTKYVINGLSISALSSQFIKFIIDFLKHDTQHQFGKALLDVLASQPKLFYRTSKENLHDLLKLSLSFKNAAFATLCFVSIMEQSTQNDNLKKTLFEPYQDKLLSLNPIEVMTQLTKSSPALMKFSFDNLSLWLGFLKNLLKLKDSDFLDIREFIKLYIDTFEVLARKRRYRDVTDLISLTNVITTQNIPFKILSDTLARLTDEIVRAYDHLAWIYLSESISSHELLNKEFRKWVEFACSGVPVDETNYMNYLQMLTQLQEANLHWDSGVLTFALLRLFPSEDMVIKATPALSDAIISVSKNNISLTNIGEWLDPLIWLVETDSVFLFCKSLVQDNQMLKDTQFACETILSKNQIFLKNVNARKLDLKNKAPQLIGLQFINTISQLLHRMLSAYS